MSPLIRIPSGGFAIVLTLALCTSGAIAQSTGNPKGTLAPPTGDSSKPTASGKASTADGSGDSGALRSDQGPSSARTATSRSPGTGTAGGLPKRSAADGADASRATASPTTNATRHPAAPAKN